MSQINLKTLQSKPLDWLGNAVVLAEVSLVLHLDTHSASVGKIGTVQMEFMALTKHTGDQKYANMALKVFNKLVTMQPPSGLYPLYIDMNSASFQGAHMS